ncbi:toll-Interleukin receptor [Cellulosimicrobium cellulans]|uniref:toll-Interleukin receptor n=1 Tax=Cellulosimicrobium cellulans TaxID=1710 RepID=UPI0036E4C351
MQLYYTADELRRVGGLRAGAAESKMLQESFQGRYRTAFDIFLSHSSLDAAVIYGLKRLLEGQGLSVYVDWVNDPELDRSRVSAATAERLRVRMTASHSLVYATSRAASQSRWMPWELGYFDGKRGPDKVAVCPIEDGSDSKGQEYLDLYRKVEKSSLGGAPIVSNRMRTSSTTLRSFARAA